METNKDIANVFKVSLELSQIKDIAKLAKDIVDYATILSSFCKNGEVIADNAVPAQKCIDYITTDVARIVAFANGKGW